MTFEMPHEAHPAGLKLRVRELDRALSFYTGMLGLEQDGTGDGAGPNGVRLGAEGGLFGLDLVEDVRAPLRPYPSVGLYHFALLLPDRKSLAAIFQKLVKGGWDFEGAADHAVSEAIYLRDPERNGIELYRDRPRETWPVSGGRVAMVTEPLDVHGLMEESPDPAPLDGQTRLGHMHLHVDDIGEAVHFYGDVLGLQTRASLPGAMFLAAGDYHHHLGLNTWAGNRRAGADSTGLLGYTWKVPPGTLIEVTGRAESMGIASRNDRGDLVLVDPIGLEVRLTEASSGANKRQRG